MKKLFALSLLAALAIPTFAQELPTELPSSAARKHKKSKKKGATPATPATPQAK